MEPMESMSVNDKTNWSQKKIFRAQVLYPKEGKKQFLRYAPSFILRIFFSVLLIKKDIL